MSDYIVTDEKLYVVKREFREIYETGHHSSAVPKIYKAGGAKSRCNLNNRRLEAKLKGGTSSFDNYWHPDAEHYKYCLEKYGQEWVDNVIEKQRIAFDTLLNGGRWVIKEVRFEIVD